MKQSINPALANILTETIQSGKRLTVLTGAGISAESGIPTFRGPEGYWTVGSKEYHPQEMATWQMFSRVPQEVWKWYLYRMDVCRQALPNRGHRALVEMETLFQDRFTLITQNVDNLHLRAGNSMARTFQIHGNIFFMRCANECREALYPLPVGVSSKSKDQDLTADEIELLKCPACGQTARPHVLWFDETYNEVYFKFESSLQAAAQTDLLIIVGTAGATNLPNQVAALARHAGAVLVDINIEANPFSRLALSDNKGYFLQESSGAALESILAVFKENAK
ncbi:MAG: RNA polymerase subunit sigma [Desulfobacterales bacterium]|nr:RNA polymerase subunit sigma [Desulfobacterales bacterium]